MLFMHGLCIRTFDGAILHFPVSLTGSPPLISAAAWSSLRALAPVWGELVDRVSRDHGYLLEKLRVVAAEDEFVRKLLLLLDAQDGALPLPSDLSVRRSKLVPPTLAVHRADYMHHAAADAWQLVEINTIAASAGSVSSRLGDLFRQFLVPRYGLPVVEDNPALRDIAVGFLEALQWHPLVASGVAQKLVLMVVQPNERNFADQRLLERELFVAHGIAVIRKTLAEVHKECFLDMDGNLMVPLDGVPCIVPLVYFRAGYGPADYPSEAEWDARLRMELSSAIKCPTVAYQLVGTKKMQEVLSQRSELEKFLQADAVDLVLKHCAAMYDLSDADQLPNVLELVRNDPGSFVMKTQREGGGNLITGSKMMELLEAGQGLCQFTLMQKIVPAPHGSSFVRNFSLSPGIPSVSELGVFTIFVSDGSSTANTADVVRNRYGGYILRTKPYATDEGGLMAGASVLDVLRVAPS